jgi:Right handed beta helix region
MFLRRTVAMWYLLVVCLLSMGVALPSAHAATYYLAPGGSGSSGCTQASPCNTTRAVQVMSGGDTLVLAGGIYNSGFGNPYTNQLPSGSSGQPTTIVAAPGAVPVLERLAWGNSGDPATAPHHILIDHIHVDGGIGVDFGNGNNITFINGVVRNAHGLNGGAINISGGKRNMRIANSKIHNAELYGFYISWYDSTLENNEIYDNNSYGLHFFCGQYSDLTLPCKEEYGDAFVGHIANNIIRNNRIWGNGYCNKWPICLTTSGNGFVLSGGSEDVSPTTSFNNQIYNNIIFNNNNAGMQIYPGVKDTLIYNNTIFNNTGPGLVLDAGGAGCCNHGPPRPVIKNNILYQNSTPIQDQGAISPVLAANLPTNPNFVGCPDGSQFCLAPDSDARNKGETLTLFNTDIVNQPRNQGGRWDIGAYEYVEGGVAAFDFALPRPSDVSVARGASVTVPVAVTYLSGTAAPVTVSASSLPAGVSASFSTNPCTPSCSVSMTVTATAGATLGTFTTPLLVGTSGSLTHQTNVTITVTAPTAVFDFSLANPGPKTLARSSAITIPLAISLLSGTAVPVTVSVTAGLPAGVTASVSATPCTPPCTSTLVLTASGDATVGTTTLTIHGTGGSQTHDITFTLAVTNAIVSSAQPIYVRKTAGSPSNSCIAAENPATAKQTIADACLCMTVPSKVMYIEGNGNTYTENIDTGAGCPITGGNGPAYDTATRIEGYGTPVPIIQAPVGTPAALFLRNNAGEQYLIIKKLTLDAANQVPNAIALYATAHHVRLEEIEAKNTGGGYETLFLAGASNIELTDVFLHDAGTDALMLDGTISNFLCQRCHLFAAVGTGLTVTSTGTKTNLTFEAPEIRNNGSVGLDLGTSTGTTIQNMINHSNNGHGVRIRAGASGTRAYNNTIYGNTGVGLQCDSGAPNTELRNNSIYGNTGGNLLNNCGATLASNLQTDPGFVLPPGNLHLADGSPAIDMGENIPSILTDYEGAPRRQGQQDIGAFERTTTPPVISDITVRVQDLTQAEGFF